jgi:hypothetical protein
LLKAIEEIGTKPTLREQLGQKGYEAFVAHWSREAHLDLYFDFIRRAAQKKFGRVPWQINNGVGFAPSDRLCVNA